MNMIKNFRLCPKHLSLWGMILLMVLLLLALSSCAKEFPVLNDNYRTYYEIFVRSYYDSDADGAGDLNGVIKKLDYISELGVKGIWLMPVMPSPSYHKYDVTDYHDIDKQYGSMDDFVRLIGECDKRGISLIIDLVINHTSSEHPWFKSAVQSIDVEPCGETVCKYDTLCRDHNKYCNYYNFAKTYPGNGYHMLNNGWYYECVFWEGMPDLNLDDKNVQDEILEIATFWLDKGVSGFRLDAPLHFFEGNTAKNTAFLQWFGEEVRNVNPNAYMVGEVWTDGGTISEYYSSGMSFFNFPFSQSEGVINNSLTKKNGYGFAKAVSDWQKKIRQININSIDAPFLSNHDNGRSAGFLMQNLEKEKLAAAMYLLMPGNSFIYYGEEIGMTGSGVDENKRQPMLWSVTDKTGIPMPVAGTDQSQRLTTGVKEQLKDKDSLLMFYRKAIAIKNKHPEIAKGVVSAIDTGYESVCALAYEYDSSTVYVLHNLSDEEITLDINELFGGKKISDSLFAAGGKASSKSIAGYATYILK